MVDIGISSNIMKSPFPKCYMTFWDMTMYNDTLNWSDIVHQFANLLPNWTLLPIFTLLPNFGGSHRTLQLVRLANRGRLLLRTPGPVPFGLAFVLMWRPFFPELVMSTDLLSFEHPSILLFCFKNINRHKFVWSILYTEQKKKGILNLVLNYAFFI